MDIPVFRRMIGLNVLILVQVRSLGKGVPVRWFRISEVIDGIIGVYGERIVFGGLGCRLVTVFLIFIMMIALNVLSGVAVENARRDSRSLGIISWGT